MAGAIADSATVTGVGICGLGQSWRQSVAFSGTGERGTAEHTVVGW